MTRARRVLKAHLLGPRHIKCMLVALKTEMLRVLWSVQDTKKPFLWYVVKHTSFPSKAINLRKTTTLYCGLSAKAKMRHFFHRIKGWELRVPLAIIRNDDSMNVYFPKASTYLLNCIHNTMIIVSRIPAGSLVLVRGKVAAAKVVKEKST
jgi:hypothetical protein